MCVGKLLGIGGQKQQSYQSAEASEPRQSLAQQPQQETSATDARNKEKQRLAYLASKSTVKTSGAGLTDEANTSGATVLGQTTRRV